MKNLESIQEDEGEEAVGSIGRGVIVAVLASSIIVGVALLRGRSSEATKSPDPLGSLLAQTKSGDKPGELRASEVKFPSMLSDDPKPTTAFAAVRTSSSALPMNNLGEPPPPTDRLPVSPLPAREVLEPSAIISRPRDNMTKSASENAEVATPSGPLSDPGHDGGYQLQVSSFRSSDEAQKFSEQLRARGHKAHVIEARVGGRGTWYRVRVGPFSSQQAASQYRSTFETKERVVPFIVPPPSKKS